LIVMDLVQVW